MNRYAIALDWCHRTADRKRARDEPPPALQNAHAREGDIRSRGSVRSGRAVRLRANGLRPPAPRARQDLHPVRLPRPPPAGRGCAVTYVQNITDVDDKIIRRRASLGIDPSDLARMFERAYLDDMRALCNDSVDLYSRASDYVDEVVSQIERLEEAGAAYATADGIYFDPTAFPDYGRLSGRTNVLRGDPVSRLDANPTSATRATSPSGRRASPVSRSGRGSPATDGPDGTSRTRRSASACWARSTTCMAARST
jgi:hypothetical protein